MKTKGKRSLLDAHMTEQQELKCAKKVEQEMEVLQNQGMTYEESKSKVCREFRISPQEVEDLMALILKLEHRVFG